MKRMFTLITRLLFIFFPGLLFAQEKNDYTIRLNSGNFIPGENVSLVNNRSDVFRNSLFGNMHYVTIQFKELPTQTEKDRLAAERIRLIDYIPNYAYTASVRNNFTMAGLRSADVRSIFQFSTEQKANPAILKGSFPEHAVKSPGTIDLTILTYEKLEAGKISNQLGSINAVILNELPVFRTFTVRITQANARQLVALPFIQW